MLLSLLFLCMPTPISVENCQLFYSYNPLMELLEASSRNAVVCCFACTLHAEGLKSEFLSKIGVYEGCSLINVKISIVAHNSAYY